MKRFQERRLEHQDPEILTPDQMKMCLEAADGERRLVAYLALGGFAGLRTQEILNQRWEDVDWAASEIYREAAEASRRLATETCRDSACAATSP